MADADGRVLVLDNGGAYVRAGWAAAGVTQPHVTMPNMIARVRRQQRLLVGDEIDVKVKDASTLTHTRVCERGFITDTFAQQMVWERLFSAQYMDVHAPSVTLTLTTQPFVPEDLERATHELVFETFGFQALSRPLAAQCAAHAFRATTPSHAGGGKGFMHAHAIGHSFSDAEDVDAPYAADIPFCSTGTGIIIDTGFSGTTIVPFYDFQPIASGIRRLDVGGKVLTNYLKELVSYRQWNMMDNFPLINDVKERLCYVSQSYTADLELARRLATPAMLRRFASAAKAPAPVVITPEMRAALSPYSARTSHAVLAPQSDGLGVGFRREYVLPDFIRVTRGYVKGSADDPHAADDTAGLASVTSASARTPKTPAMEARGAFPTAGQKRQREAVENDGAPTGAASDEDDDDTSSSSRASAAELRKSAQPGSDDDDSSDGDADDSNASSASGSSSDSGGEAQRERRPQRGAAAGVASVVAAERAGAGPAGATARPQGGTTDDLQVLVMNNERFAVPEILFSPADIGMRQGGLAAAVSQAVAGCPGLLRAALWTSVILTGGNAKLPGLEARLGAELRAVAPDDAVIQLYTPNE